jgi:hypothetical protein
MSVDILTLMKYKNGLKLLNYYILFITKKTIRTYEQLSTNCHLTALTTKLNY